ncbi:MAG TPA: hypothetical protein VF491_03500, partial [Vicinamibacterales bacterium]
MLSTNKATTADNTSTGGGESNVTVAGAVSVGVDLGTTSAFINNASIGHVGTDAVTVLVDPTDIISVTADGSNTGSGNTGVGVAVAIDTATRDNLAFVSGTTTIGAAALDIEVKPSNGSSFDAESTSGAGDPSKVGVAGSLAVNVILTSNEAYIDTGSSLTLLGSPDVSIKAASDITITTKALPAGEGGSDDTKFGIGISIAVGYGQDETAAFLGNGADVSGAKGVGLVADSVHKMDTEATGGGQGQTAITPIIAISVADNDTHATLGTGSLLTVGIDGFSASSKLTDTVQTTATGDTKSTKTGVGISISLSIVNDSSLSTTNRDIASSGIAAFMSSAISLSESIAKASSKGGEDDDASKSEDGSNSSVDGKTNAQKSFADNEKASGGQTFGFAAGDVNTLADTIQLGTGLNTGDEVKFHILDATSGEGLLNNQTYYVRDVGGGNYKFYHSADDAKNDRNAINLIGSPNGNQEFVSVAPTPSRSTTTAGTDPNKTQSDKSPSASTSSGSVSVAGAVAINIENGKSIASIPSGRHVTATGLVSTLSSANIDGHAIADGVATATGGTG